MRILEFMPRPRPPSSAGEAQERLDRARSDHAEAAASLARSASEARGIAERTKLAAQKAARMVASGG